MSSHIHVKPWLTIWWEPRRPNVIKICTGDRRFVNDEGRKPGLWISIRRCQGNRNNWNRLARAIAAEGSAGPGLRPRLLRHRATRLRPADRPRCISVLGITE